MASLPPSNGKIALVTGINGYIASWTGLYLLQAGYHLRGTVRRSASAKPLLASGLYTPYVDGGRVTIVEVPDMTVPGAYDAAVKDTSFIINIAAPVSFGMPTVAEFVEPAVRSLTSILEAAASYAPNLKMFTHTSSLAACASPGVMKMYTSDDWNAGTQQIIEAEGDAADPFHKYCFSKLQAERALWKFQDERKPSFKTAAVLPSLCWGPLVYVPQSSAGLSESVLPVWKMWKGGDLVMPSDSSIDVRDVARLLALTAEDPEVSDGKRYLISAGHTPPQAVVDVLRELGGGKYREVVQEGEKGKGYVPKSYAYTEGVMGFDARLAKQRLGSFVPLKQTLKEMVEDFEKISG